MISTEQKIKAFEEVFTTGIDIVLSGGPRSGEFMTIPRNTGNFLKVPHRVSDGEHFGVTTYEYRGLRSRDVLVFEAI